MHQYFDREALRGIYQSMDAADQLDLWQTCTEVCDLEYDDYGRISDECLPKIVEIMVKKGHILPFDIPATEEGAKEYEEIMDAQTLLEE